MWKDSSPDTKLGLINQSVIMRNAILDSIKDTSTSRTCYQICFACTIGLVSNLKKEYLHASPDYILIVNQDERREVVFAEIKCSIKIHTAYLDR